jgi:integrase/recombinase XerD
MMDKLDQFLAYLKHERFVLPNTIASYKRDISMMLDYFRERSIELEDVDHKVIRDFLLTQHKRNLKKTSIYKKISCIKSFFRFCKANGWIRKNPSKIIEYPKLDKPIPSFLTEREIEKFLPLPILELRDYAILELLYATGIRGKELRTLTWENVNMDKDEIRILPQFDKAKKGKKAVITTEIRNTLEELKKNRNGSEYVFNWNGRAITRIRYSKDFKDANIEAGIKKPYGFHEIRHTAITKAGENGAGLQALMDFAGHHDPNTTKRYLHHNWKEQQKLANGLALEGKNKE